jgi:hypothetical protein
MPNDLALSADFSYRFLIGSGRVGSARNGGERDFAQPGQVVADAVRASRSEGVCRDVGSGSARGGGQAQMGEGELVLVGTGGGHRDLDAADADCTGAPILNSLRRIVPQVASANCVCRRAIWGKAQTST